MRQSSPPSSRSGVRYLELMEDRGELARLLRVGSEKARTVASATLDRAHRAIGMLPA